MACFDLINENNNNKLSELNKLLLIIMSTKFLSIMYQPFHECFPLPFIYVSVSNASIAASSTCIVVLLCSLFVMVRCNFYHVAQNIPGSNVFHNFSIIVLFVWLNVMLIIIRHTQF